ncbi:MAG: actin-binding WH2 domain-containing protein, partial [Cyanobacteria bacterium J06628_6]
MKHFSVLIQLLRDRKNFLEDIRHDVKLERKIGSLLVSSCIFFAAYGAIIGSSSSWLQMLSSAIKLPALYLVTLIICLPTLYFFDILFGSKLNFRQYTAMLMTAIGIISVLMFSFAPVVLFFLISIQGYNFFLLLNVAVMALTGTIGIRLFYRGMKQIAGPDAAGDKLRNRLLQGWLVL